MELENVQCLLQHAGIEVDLNILQNPTEEFMIDLVIAYLNKFSIDGNEIAKPTPEQIVCLSCEESSVNAIKAINLHAALATICEGIFLKDLALTDITSPGCKKTCKRIKVLFNFFIYVRNARMEKEYLFTELENRSKELQDMNDKKNEFIAKIGSIIHEREIKLDCINELKHEIIDVRAKIDEDEKVRRNLQKRVDEIVAEHRKNLNNFNNLKTRTHELSKITKDLQSKVVKSPEEYLARMEKMKKIIEEKIEERQTLNDCINRKKNQIKNNELAETEVKKCLGKATCIGEIMNKLKETVMQINTTIKQLEELKEEIILLERTPSNKKEYSNTLETVDLEKSQQLLSELQYSLSEKQREQEILNKKLEELRIEQKKLKILLEKEKETIKSTERSYVNLLNDYRAHFENELSEEFNFRRQISDINI